MKRITPQVRPEHIEYIDQVREQAGADSDAEAIREIFDRAMRTDARLEQLEAQLDERDAELQQSEARADELRSKLVAVTDRVEASNELVHVVQEEQTLAKRQAQAGVLTRAKWWLTGMPSG